MIDCAWNLIEQQKNVPFLTGNWRKFVESSLVVVELYGVVVELSGVVVELYGVVVELFVMFGLVIYYYLKKFEIWNSVLGSKFYFIIFTERFRILHWISNILDTQNMH